MHRLRHVTDTHGRDWWEVVKDKFVTSPYLESATTYFKQMEGRTGKTLTELTERAGPVTEISDPVYLRDFHTTDERHPHSFEVTPGHIVFADNRESALRQLKDHIAAGGKSSHYGGVVDTGLIMRSELTGVHIVDRQDEETPEPEKAPASTPLRMGRSGYFQSNWWEMAPDRWIQAPNAEEATTKWATYMSGDSPNSFGRQADSLVDFEIVWAASADGTVDEEAPTKPAEEVDPMVSIMPMTRYRDMQRDLWWEVAPGRVLLADDADSARIKFARDGVGGTRSFTSADDAYNLQEFPYTPTVERVPARKFLDSAGDLWFLMIDEDGEEVMAEADTEAEAFAVLDSGDGEDPDEVFDEWGPFREVLADGSTTGPFKRFGDQNTAPAQELADEVIIKEGDSPHFEKPVPLRPTIMRVVTDTRGREWFEGLPDQWILGAEAGDTPEAVWVSMVSHEYSPHWGLPESDLRANHGPLTDKGVRVLEDEKEPPVDLKRVGGFVKDSHDRCACAKLKGDEEKEKRYPLDGYTYCVDCGKLRP